MVVSVTKFVIWICRKFDRVHVQRIVDELSAILNNPNSSIQPREPFDPDHPNYRNFKPDTQVALTREQLPQSKKKRSSKKSTRKS